MFSTVSFWAILLVAFCGMHLLAKGPRTRALVLATAGAIGIPLAVGLTLPEGIMLALSVGTVVAAALRLRRNPKMALAAAGIAFTLIVWVLGKAAVAADLGQLVPILFVGISFLLVKAWTLFKDIVDGKVEQPGAVEVAAYLLHLPTFVIGPMHQFSEFKSQLDSPYRLDFARLVDCLFRFVLGLVKVYVVAAMLAPASLVGLTEAAEIPLSTLIFAAFVYSIVLYADFSGFCDMAIATSRLIGVDVPENFNWPYAATSVRDFWRRWHITFSRALTAHIFMPMSRFLARRMKGAARVTAVSYVVTFGFCGYWHGATPNFVAWGLLHALGLIVVDAHARWLRSTGRFSLAPAPLWRRSLSIAATFTFVSMAWILFALPLDALTRIRIG